MTPTANDAITLIEVTKVFRVGLYRRKLAVDNLTLCIPTGHVVALLGANGSGKSTTLKMMLGFLKPTRGAILLGGKPASDKTARSGIGYLPENPRFQRFLRAREVMSYFGGLLGLSAREIAARTDELLELVDLRRAADERVGGFSKGMTQRLAIAQALLSRPTVLVFDEPMSGLDPLGRLEIRRLLLRIRDQMPGSTILFSTHVLSDAEALCSHVALLRQGKLERFCPMNELIGDAPQRYEIFVRDLPADCERVLAGATVRPTPLGLVLELDGADELLNRLIALRESNATIVGINSHRRTLEEALFGPTTAIGGAR